jgi:hypothetical protein
LSVVKYYGIPVAQPAPGILRNIELPGKGPRPRRGNTAGQFAYLKCRRCNGMRTRHVIQFDGTAVCMKHANPMFRRKRRAAKIDLRKVAL